MIRRLFGWLRRPVVVEDHTHQWKVIGASFQAPRSIEGWGVPPDLARAALMGVTLVTQQCSVCQRVDTDKHYGRVDLSALDLTWRKG